ncbi:hypothetical protein F5148DRAFT_1223965 [Russula earlei]|uniref:Uncharacterized protein n=1 Tax=Russula earlei TaxID=71964 RepID=A0ACC0U253_9AGAM|nr:hypothetical protein F5148DRAFT_1223965 [Russula earlei]
MSLATSQRRTSPEPLPSLLPSPSEEDLGWKGPWNQSEDELDHQGVNTSERSQFSKGKAKATGYQPPPSISCANDGTDEASNWSKQRSTTEAYPPTTDEGADTRRVQENLRRWEIAERQRWKAARESAPSMSSSIFADVARRASSFLSRRATHPPADNGGKHHALQSDNLDEIEASPPASARPSPPNTPSPKQLGTEPYSLSTNPFSDPSGSASSLFVNSQPFTSDIGASASLVTIEDPTFSATGLASPYPTKTSKIINVPAPLDLPKPLSPPPRTATPHANRPPEPFLRLDSRMSRASLHDDVEEKPVRWWTEWLCGCSEGPDRGGEVQAGRTNPLE